MSLIVIAGDGKIPGKEITSALSDASDRIEGAVIFANTEPGVGLKAAVKWFKDNELPFDAIGDYFEDDLFDGAEVSQEGDFDGFKEYLDTLSDYELEVWAILVNPREEDDADEDVSDFLAEQVEAGVDCYIANAAMYKVELNTGDDEEETAAEKSDADEDEDEDEAESGDSGYPSPSTWTEESLTEVKLPDLRAMANHFEVTPSDIRSKKGIISGLLDWAAKNAPKKSSGSTTKKSDEAAVADGELQEQVYRATIDALADGLDAAAKAVRALLS